MEGSFFREGIDEAPRPAVAVAGFTERGGEGGESDGTPGAWASAT